MAKIPLSYKVPEEAVCPFTGKPLKIIYSESLRAWRAVGDFYFTPWYSGDSIGKQELMHNLHMRDGKSPSFPRRPKIEIKELVEQSPDDVFADVLERDRAAGEFLAEEMKK